MKLFLSLFILLFSHLALADQWVEVVSEKAEIYEDVKRTKLLGTIPKGKVFRVIDRPIFGFYRILSRENQNAYIFSSDIKLFVVARPHRIGTSYFQSQSTLKTQTANGPLSKEEMLDWWGVAFKYSRFKNRQWYMQYSLKYISSHPVDREFYQFVELGVGGLYTLYRTKKWRIHGEVEAGFIPHSYYTFADEFRVHSFGASASTGVNVMYEIIRNVSLETYANYSYTKFFRFSLPSPYKDISPSVYGPRVGLGIVVNFL